MREYPGDNRVRLGAVKANPLRQAGARDARLDVRAARTVTNEVALEIDVPLAENAARLHEKRVPFHFFERGHTHDSERPLRCSSSSRR